MGKILFFIPPLVLFSCIKSQSLISCYSNQNLWANYTKLMMSFTVQSSDMIKDLKNFKLTSKKLLQFPLDKIKENYVRRNIPKAIFSAVSPTPVVSPKIVAVSEDCLRKILNLDPKISESEEFVEFLSGNLVLKGSVPLAHRYGGHQFGYWASQLGDGRAILLGEVVNANSERWELQLKGAGKTPYSRDGDGRAVLRSSIREFLGSEAMHHLGIPTTRAAAIVVSETKVIRDLLYDGHPKYEPTAIVLRLSPSWFRIGSLEILSRNDEIELLQQLVDFIITEYFPEIGQGDERILEFLSRVARLSSELVVKWQTCGFTHGVLNSDNMSILGLTIDYGPFGFLDWYDEMYVPNHSDNQARYAYIVQPQVVLFNINLLIRALAPLLSSSQRSQAVSLLITEADFIKQQTKLEFSRKLGFETLEEDLVDLLLQLLQETSSDFTMTFRELSEINLESLEKVKCKYWALKDLSEASDFVKFLNLYKQLLNQKGISEAERREKMLKRNPRYILRNWIAQRAIEEAEKGDYTEVRRLLRVLKEPWTEQAEAEERGYASRPPSWARSLQLSCSS